MKYPIRKMIMSDPTAKARVIHSHLRGIIGGFIMFHPLHHNHCPFWSGCLDLNEGHPASKAGTLA